ncbi:MAG: nucleotidyl transferase AbiEii/AbiGii toxin family protein [Arcobacteraceae bacterium]|nr:nucleotidyl transferase AbiEii/AbiGii toxin family protein [Arcobacteraceae bacterium]
MTSDVTAVLNTIKDLQIFDDELYFVGGTALSYYLNHRISEDIDIVSIKVLEYKKIIPAMLSLGAKKIEDENIFALRLAGLVPDEYIIKFVIDGVKVEFFSANRPIQKEILQTLDFIRYENSTLKVLDIKSIAKLKLVAFFGREKSRDLFDFGSMLEHKILSLDEILYIAQESKNIKEKDDLVKFISIKQEPNNDETVYLSEENRLNLSFEDIKKQVCLRLNSNYAI